MGNINSPDDLKKLNDNEITELCSEVRDVLISTVSKNGGHLASNLGVVELTVALHRFFNAPQDSIIFDVGHQCYTHKLLTGRYNLFSTLRQEGGISGFMRPDESKYDPFITGHASNSIAAAYGIHKANLLNGCKASSVAVIGDGALTGGLAFEALNNIGCENTNFMIVFNDNKMSISNNVGSLSANFKRIRLKPGYYRFKYRLETILLRLPIIGEPIFKILSKIKRAVTRQIFKNNIFETFGFKYIGPVDGHNVKQLETAFKIAKSHKKPCVIHAVTIKGKGYSFAEKSPCNYHGVASFNTQDGIISGTSDSFSTVCGETLCELAENDQRICAITAAMTSGTGLADFADRYPNRFFDVGIAEEYAATFTAGLAAGGMKPYFAVYSSFLQRSYDQIIHDVAIAKLPVCFLVDRAGIVGDDGETHQGVFDVAFLSNIPEMTVYSPASYDELKGYLKMSVGFNAPLVIRYPRGKEAYSFKYTEDDFSVFGNNGDVAIISYGIISSEVMSAMQKLNDEDIKVDFIKLNKIYPLSNDFIKCVQQYKKVYIFEEGILRGGIAEHIVAKSKIKDFAISAIDNKFVPAASVSSAREKLGLEAEAIYKTIKGDN